MRQYADESVGQSTSYTEMRLRDHLVLLLPFAFLIAAALAGAFIVWGDAVGSRETAAHTDATTSDIALEPEPTRPSGALLTRFHTQFVSTGPTAAAETPYRYHLQGYYLGGQSEYFTFQGVIDSRGDGEVQVSSDFIEAELRFSAARITRSMDEARSDFFGPIEGLVLALFDPATALANLQPCDGQDSDAVHSTLLSNSPGHALFRCEHEGAGGQTRFALSTRDALPVERWDLFNCGREFHFAFSNYRSVGGRTLPHTVIVRDGRNQQTTVYLRLIRAMKTEAQNNDSDQTLAGR